MADDDRSRRIRAKKSLERFTGCSFYTKSTRIVEGKTFGYSRPVVLMLSRDLLVAYLDFMFTDVSDIDFSLPTK